MMTTTLQQLRDVLETDFEIAPADITPETNFIDVGLDSLSLAEFMFVIEDKLQVDFSGEHALVSTVADLVASIDRLRSSSLASAA